MSNLDIYTFAPKENTYFRNLELIEEERIPESVMKLLKEPNPVKESKNINYELFLEKAPRMQFRKNMDPDVRKQLTEKVWKHPEKFDRYSVGM